jgi:hypothetical protein
MTERPDHSWINLLRKITSRNRRANDYSALRRISQTPFLTKIGILILNVAVKNLESFRIRPQSFLDLRPTHVADNAGIFTG